MIPENNRRESVTRERLPARTFFLDADGQVVRGMTDAWEAARQAVWLILHTERYRHEIFSFQYGAELGGLIGKRDSFLFPEVKRRVTEAVMVDDRVTGTSDFRFSRIRNRVAVRFIVHTIYGDMEEEMEV